MNFNEYMIKELNEINKKQKPYYDIIEKYENLIKNFRDIKLKYNSTKNQVNKNINIYDSESTDNFAKTIKDLTKINNELEIKNVALLKNLEKYKEKEKKLNEEINKKNEEYTFLNNLYVESQKNKTNSEKEYLKLKNEYDKMVQQIILEKTKMAEQLSFINEQEEIVRNYEKELRDKAKSLDEKNKLIKKSKIISKNKIEDNINNNDDEFWDLEIKFDSISKKKIEDKSKVLYTCLNYNEDKIYISTENYSILSYSINQGNFLDKFKLKNKWVTCIDTDPQNSNNLLVGASNKIEVFDMKKERNVLTLNHNEIVNSCKYFENNKVFSCSSDNTIKLWDLKKADFINSMYYSSSGVCGDIDNCLYYTGHKNGNLLAWNSKQKTFCKEINLKYKIDFLKVNESENSIICSSRHHEINIIDLRTDKIRNTINLEKFDFDSNRYSISADKDLYRLFLGDDKGNLLIYDVLSSTPKLEKSIKISNYEINNVLYSNINDIIIVTDINGDIYFNKCSINI